MVAVHITAPVLAHIALASVSRVSPFVDPLNAAMTRFGIITLRRAAAFLPQIACESEGFRRLEECLNYTAAELLAVFHSHFNPESAAQFAHSPEAIANRVYASRMGNGDEKSGDGYRYRGRGLIQITGKYEYEKCGSGIAAPLVDHPELLEQPEHAANSAAWFWSTNGLNELADAGRFTDITEKINGGLNGESDREMYWRRAKTALGVT